MAATYQMTGASVDQWKSNTDDFQSFPTLSADTVGEPEIQQSFKL
jgi:hypothetical protein